MKYRIDWLALALTISGTFSFPLGASAQSSKPAPKHKSSWQLPEAGEMLLAIARGSEMGPGGGWFHSGQSRFGWPWLKKHFGKGAADAIRREDFRGATALFDRLDRNRDGRLTQADFDWSERSPYFKEVQPSANWFRLADKNSNGKISREEWLEIFDHAAKGKDYLSPEDLRESFPLSPPRPSVASSAPPRDGPSSLTLAKGVLSGELGSVFEGPRIGQSAPDFTLGTVDGKNTVHMADHLGNKPVVLVFGSFT